MYICLACQSVYNSTDLINNILCPSCKSDLYLHEWYELKCNNCTCYYYGIDGTPCPECDEFDSEIL